MASGLPSFYTSSIPSSSSQSPFLLVPSQRSAPPSATVNRPRPSFLAPSPQTASTHPGQSTKPPAPTFTGLVPYRPPAHKHAHHLHSIPPREKTTRTLILDRGLWLHTQARLNQARSELGMSPASALSPPTTSEADPNQSDEHEDAHSLSFRVPDDVREKGAILDANRFVHKVNLDSARAQKATADGMEKVLSSMLRQTADLNDRGSHDDITRPPLPNGVRLRLAISALVNDFFSQDLDAYDPVPDPNESPMAIASIVSAPTTNSVNVLQSPEIPSSISPLAPISSYKSKAGTSVPTRLPPPAGSIFSSIPRGAGLESPWALGASSTPLPSSKQSGPAPRRERGPRVWKAVGRSRDLYNGGARRSNRVCARHLTEFGLCPPSCTHISSSVPLSPRMSRRTLSQIGAGLSQAASPLRRRQPRSSNDLQRHNSRMIELLPRFLRLSALVARELGREMRGQQQHVDDSAEEGASSSASSSSFPPSSSAAPIPAIPIEDVPSTTGDARPSREWYALLSGIVTRAALEGYLGLGWKGPDALEVLFGLGIGVDWNDAAVQALAASATARNDSAARSSPVVETFPIQDDDEDADSNDGSDEEDDLSTFEPDDMPTLAEAGKILFGRGIHPVTAVTGHGTYASYGYGFTTTRWSPATLRPGSGGGDQEWEAEMAERVSEFASIHQNSPDLISHLHELSRQYPPEPIERAAVKFCEAIALWRGTPELEVYKERAKTSSPHLSATSRTSSSGSLSAYLNNVPDGAAPSKPAILSYFVVPRKIRRDPPTRKRNREDQTSDGKRSTKSARIAEPASSSGSSSSTSSGSTVNEMVDSTWTGPYGV